MRRINLRRIVSLAIAIATMSSTAFAQELKPRNFDERWRSWTWGPMICAILMLSAVLYWLGIRRFRIMSQRREHMAFAAGWLTLLIAFVSPLYAWGRVLFSAHVAQNEILMIVAAPLLIVGRPITPILLALPLPLAHILSRGARTQWFAKLWQFLTAPVVAWLIYALALWIWHVPFLLQTTAHSEWIHALQLFTVFASALLFWWCAIFGRRTTMRYRAIAFYFFTTALHTGILGVLLTFASHYWYPIYRHTTLSWGLTSLQDQRLGGLILWIPAGLVYLLASFVLLTGWLRRTDRYESKASHLNFRAF
jgi:putative membrane protein